MGIVRNKPNVRRRKINPQINQPKLNNPLMITSVQVAGTLLTITFDSVVSLERGTVPAFTTDIVGAVAVSAEQTGPNG